ARSSFRRCCWRHCGAPIGKPSTSSGRSCCSSRCGDSSATTCWRNGTSSWPSPSSPPGDERAGAAARADTTAGLRSGGSMGRRMKVGHIITGLRTGGAEVMLLRLLKQLRTYDYDPYVVGLTEPGPVSDEIVKLGVPLEALSARRGAPGPAAVY